MKLLPHHGRRRRRSCPGSQAVRLPPCRFCYTVRDLFPHPPGHTRLSSALTGRHGVDDEQGVWK